MLPPPEGIWGIPIEQLRPLPGYALDVAKSREEGREIMPGDSCQFGRLPKRKDALGIERDAKLSPQTRFHLRLWKPQAAGNGLRCRS